MKKLLNLFLKLIGRAKVADLDNDGKVETINEEIQGLFSQFKTMSDQLDNANGRLKKVIEDEKFAQEVERDQLERIIESTKKRIDESEQVIAKAEKGINNNTRIKSKVDEFVVED